MTTESFELQVQGRLQVIESQYEDRLDAEQLNEVRQGVEAIVRAAEALRGVRLENGDEPSGVFTPYREEA